MTLIKLRKENVENGNLILINQNNLFKQKAINLVPFNDKYKSIKLEKNTNEQLHLLLKKIKSENEIVPVSGYRTKKEQTDIYKNSLRDNGKDFTQKFVALPNASEHQSGLAIDLALNKKNIDFLCPDFPNDGICEDFRKGAAKYGFIERYKDDKKNITKICKEEWHFRYVGYPHSEIMNNLNFCLEEYIDFLRQFTYPNNPIKYLTYYIYYVPYIENCVIELKQEFSVSGNNVDGIILTVKGYEE